MPAFLDKQTGDPVFIPSEEVQATLAKNPGRYEPIGTPALVAPETGQPVYAPEEGYDAAVQSGLTPESEADRDVRAQEHELDEVYGSQNLTALVEALARGATFSGSDVLLRALGADAFAMRQRRERNPYLAVGGEILGSVAPMAFTGGAGALGAAARATPAGAVARASEKAARSLVGGGRGLGASTARGATAGLLEGTAWETGHALGQAALSDDPFTVESIASQLKTKNILTGAALGAGVGGAFGALGSAVRKLTAPTGADDFVGQLGADLRVIDNELAGINPEEIIRQRAFREFSEDVASRPDSPLLSRADELSPTSPRDAEQLSLLADDVVPAGEPGQLEMDLGATPSRAGRMSREEIRDYAARLRGQPARSEGSYFGRGGEYQRPFQTGSQARPQVSRMADDVNEAALARAARQADETVPSQQMDLELGSTPGRQLDLLDEAALTSRQGDQFAQPPLTSRALPADEAMARARAQYAKLPEAVEQFNKARNVLRKSVGDDFNLGKFFDSNPEEAVNILRRLDVYQKAATRLDTFLGGRVGVGEKFGHRAVLSGIEKNLPKGVLDKLNALDAVAAADLIGLVNVEQVGVFGPTADALLKVYAAGRFLRGHARKQNSLMNRVMQGSMEGFIAPVSRGTGALPRIRRNAVKRVIGFAGSRMSAIPMLAGAVPAIVHRKASKAVKALTSNHARRAVLASSSKVLNSVKFYDAQDRKEEQGYKARAKELRDALANESEMRDRITLSTAPVTALNPSTGAQLQDAIWARMMFLASKMPSVQRNEILMNLGQGKEVPSPTEVSRWARYIRAAEDPMSLLDDLGEGVVAVEAVETVKTLYPALFEEMQMAIVENMTELRQNLSYSGRLQLSVMFDVPVEASMAPDVMQMLQSIFQQQAEQAQANAPRPSQGTPKTDEHMTKAQRMTER
jgi:hypothetical protein